MNTQDLQAGGPPRRIRAEFCEPEPCELHRQTIRCLLLSFRLRDIAGMVGIALVCLIGMIGVKLCQ